jgi:hypothetical protein
MGKINVRNGNVGTLKILREDKEPDQGKISSIEKEIEENQSECSEIIGKTIETIRNKA